MAGAEQSQTSSQETVRETRLREAATNLQNLFSGNTRLTITESRRGNERVRTFIPDEDGYAGWTENASFLGVVQVNENGKTKYKAERHFPYQSRKRTYFWDFDPDTKELLVSFQDGGGSTPQFDLQERADDEYTGYFWVLASDVANTYGFNDLEHERMLLPSTAQYTFQLEDLQ